ncbi:MAG: glycosyltransferase family 39 protein [Bacteroidetes bacterium]|nr:glycosyltransferase family 39 protein [Bacteroidota bacterium]
MNFRKQVLLLILLSSIARCCIAIFLEFGNDEVYYWTYAQHLEWNYFDHPPMVALLIRLTTFNLHLQSEFFVRLGPMVCAAFNTWMMFLVGTKIRDERTGWYASLMYVASFYCSVIAGTFILPDSPQLLFWVWSVYLMTSLIDENAKNKNKNKNLLLLGISIGLCIMSKVHGMFLWFGFGLYILFYQRSFLKSFYLYLAILISIIIISPIFFWNLANHFITYSFHNNRVGFFGKHLDTDSFLQQIFGSIFYNNPANIFLYVVALVAIARKKIMVPSNWLRLYLLLALPLIIVLLLMSLFNETLPHWSGPAYITIMLITAFYFSTKNAGAKKIPKGISIALGLFFGIIILGIPLIKFIPIQLGNKEERIFGKGDVTLDMTGWEKFSSEFDSLYRDDATKGTMQKNAMLIADNWFPAAHLDYYLAQPMHVNLFAVGKLTDIHHYAWLNKERPELQKGMDAYFIYPSNYYGPPRDQLKKYFRRVDDSLIIKQIRANIPVRNFVIYRMHDYLGGIGRDGVLE